MKKKYHTSQLNSRDSGPTKKEQGATAGSLSFLRGLKFDAGGVK